jgi:CHASE3 domain sensor protein
MTTFEISIILISLLTIEFIFGAISFYQHRKSERHFYSVMEYQQLINKLTMEIAYLKEELGNKRADS